MSQLVPCDQLIYCIGDSDLYRGHTIEMLFRQALNLSIINSSTLLHMGEKEYTALERWSPQLSAVYHTQLRGVRPEGLIAAQRRIGLNGFESLIKQRHSAINKTVFHSTAQTIHLQFEPFLPEHCKLLSL